MDKKIDKNKKTKENNKAKRAKRAKRVEVSLVRLIAILLSILILAICFIYIFNWFTENKNNEELLKVVQEESVKIDDEGNIKIDFDKLKEINSDVVGWIKVNNTNINYPVVQYGDNSFYLSHSLNKEYNAAGWPFVDYTVNLNEDSRNITIYGHNRKDGSMFGSLKKVLTPEWYENDENLKIEFITENGEEYYQVFSVYEIEKEIYYTNSNFTNDEEYADFLDELQSRSIKDFDVDVSTEDRILTLSTCANNNFYRVVLHAKKI